MVFFCETAHGAAHGAASGAATDGETFDTVIATPAGEVRVSSLRVGDLVRTADGRDVPVRWIGRQRVHRLFGDPHAQPVRIHAGALGPGVPHADLVVTAEHALILDGLAINAGALVNRSCIDFVPACDLPELVCCCHVETEQHDVTLANGAPAESFLDSAGRIGFDNFDEYLALYGSERIIPEMAAPRISSNRMLPEAIRTRLGIPEEFEPEDTPLWA